MIYLDNLLYAEEMRRQPAITLWSALLTGCVAVNLLLSAPVAAADSAGSLHGSHEFHGRTPVVPPSGEVPHTHLGLVLEGAVARDLYRRMKGRAVRDACLDDGARSKMQRPLRCTELADRRG